MPERIQKILSAHGIASRREAEKMIMDGRVTIGGVPARLGQSAQFGIDDIAVDNVPLTTSISPIYIMLNKPVGYIATMNDERGRKTVVELVSGVSARVYPIGRLDMDSEGLLLMTNDGAFANLVAHPSNNITKTYEVTVEGNAAGAVAMLRRPMQIDGHSICAISVEYGARPGNGGILTITISEGRNRQIRKMCALCGLKVRSLKRISIGSVELGALHTGQWRYLTQDEVRSLSGS